MFGRSDALYVVRIWYESDGARQVWRASVTDAYRSERRFFTTLQNLQDFFGESEDDGCPLGEIRPGGDSS